MQTATTKTRENGGREHAWKIMKKLFHSSHVILYFFLFNLFVCFVLFCWSVVLSGCCSLLHQFFWEVKRRNNSKFRQRRRRRRRRRMSTMSFSVFYWIIYSLNMNRGTNRIFVFCFQLLPTAHYIIIIVNLKLYMRSSSSNNNDDNNAQIMYARTVWWCSFGAFVSITIPISHRVCIWMCECQCLWLWLFFFCLRFHLFIMIIISFRRESYTFSTSIDAHSPYTPYKYNTQTNKRTKKNTYLVCPHIITIITSRSSTATKEQQQQKCKEEPRRKK